MHAAGVRDTTIAEELRRPRSVVHRARKRLGLAPHYGPGRHQEGEPLVKLADLEGRRSYRGARTIISVDCSNFSDA